MLRIVARLARISASLVLGAAGWAAAAAEVPPAPVRLVVPYPAGGASDFAARLLQPPYQHELGRPIVVENVGGASGALGVQRVLEAPPDGRVQLLATPIELVLTPLALPAVTYRPEDLRLAALVGHSSLVLLVRSGLPVRSLDELIEHARTHDVSFGSTGVGSLTHLMGVDFAARSGARLSHVPYKSGAQLLNDLAGDHLDVAFFALAGPVYGMLKDGRFRALGISQPHRHPLLDVPPLSRHRLLRGFDFDSWLGLQVPRAVPDDVVARINRAMNAALDDATLRRSLEAVGGEPARPMTVEQLERFYASETERYRAIARSAGLQPK